MFTIVLVGLILALLATAVLAGAIFLRGAFWGEKDAAARLTDVATWRPSFLQGDALRDWAASTTEHFAAQRLNGKRNATTAIQLVAEIEQGALHAMLPLAREAELERAIACPQAGQGVIGVTAVEVLAIAADLRRKHSPAEQAEILAMAGRNAEIITRRGHDVTAGTPLPCPLQGVHHLCRTYASRPLQCRPLHAFSVAKTMGSRRVELSGTKETPAATGHEQTVAAGIAQGLSRALTFAHLDGNTYELNSALARALELPDAAERWARGETIFGSCIRVDLTSPEQRETAGVSVPAGRAG